MREHGTGENWIAPHSPVMICIRKCILIPGFVMSHLNDSVTRVIKFLASYQ